MYICIYVYMYVCMHIYIHTCRYKILKKIVIGFDYNRNISPVLSANTKLGIFLCFCLRTCHGPPVQWDLNLRATAGLGFRSY